MLKRFLATAIAMAASSIALAQGVTSVSLDPTAPAGRITADIFYDVAQTDVWTAGGFRGVTLNGATFHYGRTDDPNTGQPDQLIGPYSGTVTDQHVTCFSKPRASRTSNNRFNLSTGAAIAGRYSPTGATAVGSATEVNIAYFASPPEGPNSPAVDGYIGRITLDANVPAGNTVAAGLLADIPAGATVLMRSEVAPGQSGDGSVSSTFDFPTIVGISWAIWYVPEPTSLALLALGGLAALRRR